MPGCLFRRERKRETRRCWAACPLVWMAGPRPAAPEGRVADSEAACCRFVAPASAQVAAQVAAGAADSRSGARMRP